MFPTLPFAALRARHHVHLRILATTDLHVQIYPYDYYADRAAQTVGLSRVAGLIGTLRAQTPNTVLLDNGDFLQGNPMGDLVAAEGLKPGATHPMIAAMNTVGYDAAALGNHEFNYGIEFLRDCLAGASFPVVSANVVTNPGLTIPQDRTLLPPYVILDRQLADDDGRFHPIRIGVIGLLPPQIMVWDQARLQGHVTTRDIVATAAARVPQMKADGADLIIALCHSGIGNAAAQDGMENAAVALAAVPGIDAVIAGHSHLVFPGPAFAGHAGVDIAAGTLAGKPAVMAGCFGSHLGVIDLLLDRGPDGWRVINTRAEAISVADIPATAAARHCEQAVLASASADHLATLDYIRRPVGMSKVALNSFFAVLPGDMALRLVARAQQRHVEQALHGTTYQGLPVLSATAPFKMGGRGGPSFYADVAPGALALRNLADLYLYPNTIHAVVVNGAELIDWLHRSAGIFARIIPGLPEQPLLDPEVPSSHFDVIDGLTWQIDLSQPARFDLRGNLVNPQTRRIRALCHGGRPVAPDDHFIVATNNYRAATAAIDPKAGQGRVILAGAELIRDILLRHVTDSGTVGPMTEPGWSFAPLPGTSVIYDTSPRAADHLAALATLRIETLGAAPGGFARFRIHL